MLGLAAQPSSLHPGADSRDSIVHFRVGARGRDLSAAVSKTSRSRQGDGGERYGIWLTGCRVAKRGVVERAR